MKWTQQAEWLKRNGLDERFVMQQRARLAAHIRKEVTRKRKARNLETK